MNTIVCDDDYINKLLTNLKVIGKIGPGFKINTKGKYLQLDDTTYWQGLLRWYRGDSRNTMYEKVHSTISASQKIVNMLIRDLNYNPEEPKEIYNNCTPGDFLRIVYQILKGAKSGMESLKDTYDPDPTLSSRLEMDIISVSNQLLQIDRTLNE